MDDCGKHGLVRINLMCKDPESEVDLACLRDSKETQLQKWR